MTSLQKSNPKSSMTDLNDREFKTAVMKKFNEIQENLESQSNRLRN